MSFMELKAKVVVSYKQFSCTEMTKQGLNILELPVKCVQFGTDCSIPPLGAGCWPKLSERPCP